MTNEAKIIAMKLVDDVRTNGATIVANFDFVTSGIEVGGATLAIGDRGIVMTWCPRVTTDRLTIKRYVKIDDENLREAVTKDAYSVYRALGGQMTGWLASEKPEPEAPIERRIFPATFTVDDDDDASGLHTFLKADAVAETCDRAGL